MTQALVKLDRGVYELPKPFVKYVERKIREGRKRGRPHLVKRLATLENVLEVLVDLWIDDKSITEEAEKLGISRVTLYSFLKDVEPFKEKITEHLQRVQGLIPKDFRRYASICQWEDMIRLSGHLSSLRHIRSMERICTGEILRDFRCSPDRFDLERTKEFVSKYLREYRKLKLPYNLRMAIRSFLASRSIVIPRGFGAQYGISGEKNCYGKYAHVKLSDDQIDDINEIIRHDPIALETGYDIGFNLGIETCSRAFAIGSIRIDRIWKEDEFHILEVFEPKIKANQHHLGYVGKWWRKYITRGLYERIQDFIQEHPKRTLLFAEKPTKTYVLYWLGSGLYYHKSFRAYLKKVYRKAGIREEFFYSHSVHSLRHVGAHRLLRKTNYNYSLVARLGGWTDEKTLKDCYGRMPDELILNVLRSLER